MRAGRVEIAADSDHRQSLHSLRTRFGSAQTITNHAFDVELDDLLVNLYELASWPATDRDVQWEPALLALVEGNAADSETVQRRLESDEREDSTPAPSAHDL